MPPRNVPLASVDPSSVNAATKPDQSFARKEASPTLVQLIGSVTDAQMGRYSFETLALLEEEMNEWAKQAPEHAEYGRVRTHLIELDFEQVEDPDERHYRNNVKTSFHLSDETVDRLIAAGRDLLRTSPDFQELLGQPSAEGPEPELSR